jgi:hypothetical protein
MFNTPILFLIFNRPNTTKIVFSKIKELKPKYLFVSADGARPDKPNEKEKCNLARSVIDDIDWDCELKTNFSDVNLGCKNAVSSAITWFFQNVNEGIILEDDCLPDISFFHFCESLLEKYRNDNRIMHIGGVNFQDGAKRGDGSYYFSKISHVWGWATWKRAWDKYDVNITNLPEFVKQNAIANVYPNTKMQKYFLIDFNLVYKHQKDTWDFQWTFTLAVNNGLAIIPNKNLVSNIGFGADATHTVLKSDSASNRPFDKIDTLVDPLFVIPNFKADLYTFKKYMKVSKFKKIIRFFS